MPGCDVRADRLKRQRAPTTSGSVRDTRRWGQHHADPCCGALAYNRSFMDQGKSGLATSMDIAEYSTKLDTLGKATALNMSELAIWTEKVGLPWLWMEMGGAVLKPKKQHPLASRAPRQPVLRPMGSADAVRNGLMASLADRRERASDPLFFQAQLTMLDDQARLLCSTIHECLAAEDSSSDATVDSLHRHLLDIMRQARILLAWAGDCVTKVPGYYSAGRRTHDSAFEVIQAARQIIYGSYSRLAFADRAASVPVAILRTAIELRLRDAFCIWGLVNQDDQTDMQPVDMSRLFDALAAHKGDMQLAVDLHDVWRIYRWSNHYLHAGFRDFPWVPGFLLSYLWPLFTGGQAPSINAGIQLSEETWRSVRASLAPRSRSPSVVERLTAAWQAVRAKAPSRVLELPECEPRHAACVFVPSPSVTH